MRYLSILILLVSLVACKKDKNEATTGSSDENSAELPTYFWKPVADATPYVMGDVLENTSNNYRYFFTDIRILSTNISAQNTISASALFDKAENKTSLGEIQASNDMSLVGFNIGVPEEINHADPSDHPSESALNISNASDMHWGWNPGYIFVKIEGRVDTTDNGIDDFDYAFAYHLGGDTLFRSLSNLSPSKEGDNYFTKIELRKLFDDPNSAINLKSKSSTHSGPSDIPFATKLMNNLVNAFE